MNTLRRPVASLVLVLLALTALSRAADAPPAADVPLVEEKVRELMQDRNYAEAIQAIDKAAQADDAPKDYLTYLKGRALFLQQTSRVNSNKKPTRKLLFPTYRHKIYTFQSRAGLIVKESINFKGRPRKLHLKNLRRLPQKHLSTNNTAAWLLCQTHYHNSPIGTQKQSRC